MPGVTLGNLKAWGPIIDVAVGLSGHRAKALERASRFPVLPLFVKALIDTGSTTTGVTYSVIHDLGLLAKGETLRGTPTTGSQRVKVPTFDIQLLLIGPGPPHVIASPALRVFAMELSHLGVRALLGRDVLAKCHLAYDGPSDQFTFSF